MPGVNPLFVVRSLTVPAPAPPLAPTGLVARPLSGFRGAGGLEHVSTETGYRSNAERRIQQLVGSGRAAGEYTDYVDANVLQGTQYFYRVQAFTTMATRRIQVEVAVVPAIIATLIEDDFDPDPDVAVWASISGGVATNGGQGFPWQQSALVRGRRRAQRHDPFRWIYRWAAPSSSRSARAMRPWMATCSGTTLKAGESF